MVVLVPFVLVLLPHSHHRTGQHSPAQHHSKTRTQGLVSSGPKTLTIHSHIGSVLGLLADWFGVVSVSPPGKDSQTKRSQQGKRKRGWDEVVQRRIKRKVRRIGCMVRDVVVIGIR